MNKNIWTMNRDTKQGAVLQLCFHRVVIKRVMERTDHYSKCEVNVLGPVLGSAGIDPTTRKPYPIPPLTIHGEIYDAEGAFQDQA